MPVSPTTMIVTPEAPAPPSSGADPLMLLVGLVVLMIGLYEHQDSVAEIWRRLALHSRCSLAYHVFTLCVVWALTIASVEKDEKSCVRPSPSLFICQALLAAGFWAQEGLRAAWKKECSVACGTLLLSAVSLATRLCAHLGGDGAYPPTGWSAEGLYQCAEVTSLGIILLLLVSTEIMKDWVRAAPKNDARTSVTCMMALIIGLAAATSPDLAKNRVLDTLWAFSMFLDSVSLVPQIENLAMASARGFVLHSASTAPLAMHRALGLFFWAHSFDDLPPQTAFVLYSLQVCAVGFIALVFVGQAYYGSKPQRAQGTIRAAQAGAEAGAEPQSSLKEEPTLNQIF